MEINIPNNEHKYLYVLKMLSFMPPFSDLTKAEREVLSEFFRYNEELDKIDFKKRQKLIFDYDTILEISEKFSMQKQTIYNVIWSLKKKGFLKKTGKGPGSKSSFNPKLLLTNINNINFKFINK